MTKTQSKNTARLKCNPPLGRMPVLQFIPPAELQVDPAYQRSLEARASQTLIRRIAQHWDWGLCQPLVVSQREDRTLYVIDGQHRLEAAKLRRDIGQLPCVVVQYSSAADEAANFVALNQQRRPLAKLDVFKAALASGDDEACGIKAAMDAAGLSIANTTNHASWQPGMVSHIGGLERAWRQYGADVSTYAMRALFQGFKDQQLQYAGTLYPGIAAVCSDEMEHGVWSDARFAQFCRMLGQKSQVQWRGKINLARGEDANLNFARASAQVLRRAWKSPPAIIPVSDIGNPDPIGNESNVAAAMKKSASSLRSGTAGSGQPEWCTQCEERKSPEQAAICASQFCKLKAAAA